MNVKGPKRIEREIKKRITYRGTLRFFLLLLVIMTGFPVDEAALPENVTLPPRPPSAKKVPKVDTVHGEHRVDDYFWLREKTNPEVAAYLNAENAYTDAVMKPSKALQEALYQEMLSHIKETDLSVPYQEGGYFYYSRTQEGKQYPIYCRKKGSLDAPEEVTLDLNELAKGEKFMALGAYTVSDDGKFLAYSTDNTGFRQYTLRVKDLESGQLLSERIEKTESVVWANDRRTLFYSVEDSAKRPFRLYRHRLGTTIDDLVYEEKDELFRISASRSRSKAYLFMGAVSLTTSEWRYLPADRPEGAWNLVAPRVHGHEYDVEHHGDLFYIRTNDKGRNFRLASAPVSHSERENWKEVVPHRADVMLEGVECFRNHYALLERENGIPQISVTDFRSGQSHRVKFPEPAYATFPAANREWDTSLFRYSYQSLVTPSSVFDYDMDQRESKLLKQTEVPGGFNPAQYESERIYATAKDGVHIPISLVYKKGMKRDGSAPMHLVGYGSYGFPYPVSFSSNRLVLVDRGIVFAIAHIRGGGEMGKPWHDQGRMMHKKNTFTDFVATAEHLMAQKYTSKERLVVEGGSAGGLLMGAVVNMRSDLFRGAILHVPFVDVINTMLDESLPLTVEEFEEWGNPKKKEEYDYIKTYCPYTNLKGKAYPAMLVKTSFNDSQVMYWEPAKFVAKLRTLKTDKHPLLLKTNMAAGHGGASGRYDHLREVAFDYAFFLTELGITK
jgi:oligopeptidase B